MMRVLRGLQVAFALVALLVFLGNPHGAYPEESADAFLYKTGLDAHRKGEFEAAADFLRLLLQRFPDTPLRDVATFWLASSSYRAGDHEQAAVHIKSFCRDFPDSPLLETAEKGLLRLASSPASALQTSAAKKEAEELHRAELQRIEDEMKKKLAADPEARRLAADRKIQQIRDALRKQDEKRQMQKGAADKS